jgi:hypothetical protein
VEVLLGAEFSTRSVPRSYKKEGWGDQVSSVLEIVGRVLDACGWGVSAFGGHCRGVVGVEAGGWWGLGGCCGDLRIVGIGGGAVIACNSESCHRVVGRSIHQSKPRL